MLNASRINGSYTAAYIAQVIKEKLKIWFTSMDQAQVILHDNGSNMVRAMKGTDLGC